MAAKGVGEGVWRRGGWGIDGGCVSGGGSWEAEF